MKMEMITQENISKYLKLLSNDEVFGLEDGRFSAFGATEDDTDTACGVLVAHILPEFIRIVKLFTLPEYRRRGIATTLLEKATDLPEELAMPFYVISAGEQDFAFLEKNGFQATDDRYFFLSGWLEDLEDLPKPSKPILGQKILPADHIPYESLSDYVLKSSHDEILQFPEKELDMARFSDGSLVCTQNNDISAVVLMEEMDEYIQISWIHCKDSRSLYSIFSVMKKALKTEYDPEAELRFLLCNEKGEDAIDKLFRYRDRIPVKVYKLGKENSNAD